MTTHAEDPWDVLANLKEGWFGDEDDARRFGPSPVPTAGAIALLKEAHTLVTAFGLKADAVDADILGGVIANYETDTLSISLGVRNDYPVITVIALRRKAAEAEAHRAHARSYKTAQEAADAVLSLV